MTQRVPTAIGGITGFLNNKDIRRHHVSSPSHCPFRVITLYYNAGMGTYHMVVPHAEFVLQVATPWTFTIMIKTLTKLLCEQVSNFHFQVFSFHAKLVFILHAFEFPIFTVFVQNSKFSQSARAYRLSSNTCCRRVGSRNDRFSDLITLISVNSFLWQKHPFISWFGFTMSSAGVTPNNPLLRRVQGTTRATDLATARNNLRTVSQGGRPAMGSARRVATPRGAVGPRVSSQSGDD